MSNDKLSTNAMQEMSKVDRSKRTDELAKRILASVSQSFSGSEQTMNWLKNVDENVSAGAIGDQTGQQPIILSMVAIIDKLFDDFQRYAFQFNQTEPNRDYVITCNRAEPKRSADGRQGYDGFLQNSAWAMLIHGEPNLIRATFVSPRFLYEDENRRPVVMPFLEFNGAGNPGNQVWKLNDHPIQFAHLPAISKAMFARMIRVSRGEVGENERLPISFEEQPSKPSEPEIAEVNPRDEKFEGITNAIINLLESIDCLLPDLQKRGSLPCRKVAWTDFNES